MNHDDVRFTHIQSGEALEEIRALFLEYARGLNFNLCFQNFDKELAELPGPYNLPRGRLILGQIDGRTAGCIALKPLEPGICEMKRLFVRPEFRWKHIGLKLARHIVDEARVIGYSAMRLDTIRGTMDNAIGLYASLGFREIPAYYVNPIPNAYYMQLDL
jgi:ribosomal protein S18 acetylase RimI-like enzyme